MTKLPITKPTKAVIAAVGTTLTAAMTAFATVTVAASDDALDTGEIGSIVAALITAGITVWGVWRVPNRPVETDEKQTYTRGGV